jgi:hypothetical protein
VRVSRSAGPGEVQWSELFYLLIASLTRGRYNARMTQREHMQQRKRARRIARMQRKAAQFRVTIEQAEMLCSDEVEHLLPSIELLHKLLAESREGSRSAYEKYLRKHLRMLGHRQGHREGALDATTQRMTPSDVDWRPTEVMPEDHYAL